MVVKTGSNSNPSFLFGQEPYISAKKLSYKHEEISSWDKEWFKNVLLQSATSIYKINEYGANFNDKVFQLNDKDFTMAFKFCGGLTGEVFSNWRKHCDGVDSGRNRTPEGNILCYPGNWIYIFAKGQPHLLKGCHQKAILVLPICNCKFLDCSVGVDTVQLQPVVVNLILNRGDQDAKVSVDFKPGCTDRYELAKDSDLCNRSRILYYGIVNLKDLKSLLWKEWDVKPKPKELPLPSSHNQLAVCPLIDNIQPGNPLSNNSSSSNTGPTPSSHSRIIYVGSENSKRRRLIDNPDPGRPSPPTIFSFRSNGSSIEILKTQKATIKPAWNSGPFLSYLFSGRLLADFTFVSSDGKEHPAHKVVLAARSSVLLRLFREQPGVQRQRLEFGGIRVTSEAADAFLTFIYKWDTNKIWTLAVAVEMVVLGYIYGLPDLVAICSKILLEKLQNNKEDATECTSDSVLGVWCNLLNAVRLPGADKVQLLVRLKKLIAQKLKSI